PYWRGIQLDEVAFPILLAWRLDALGALGHFDPYPMAPRAAAYLIPHCPPPPQGRREENSGDSPPPPAAHNAALGCAAELPRARGDAATAAFILDYADFLESHVEAWTVTTSGALVPGLPRHYIRIHPTDPADPSPDEDPDHGELTIRNQRPGARFLFP